MFSTFCGSGSYNPNEGEAWRDAAVRCMRYGADTLMNGLTPISMRGHRDGASFINPIDTFDHITEAQAVAQGLALTNLHPVLR